MAKKEKSNNKIDGDLDFDDLNFDDLDSDLDIDDIDPFDRKPNFSEISKEVAKEAGKGFLEGLVKKTTEKALPESYSSEYYTVLDYVDFTKEVLEESKSKIEKSLYYLGKEVKKVLPFQIKILNDFLEKYEAEKEQFIQQSEEQQREINIQSSLTNIFDKQLEIQTALKAKDEAKREAERKQDLGISKLTIDILRNIDVNVANKTAFTLQISKEYYKKSLELQYKSYFIQLDMLKTMRDYYKSFSSQFDIIAKNTGLPDFVKLQNREILDEVIRTNISQSIYKQVFDRNEYIRNIKAKLNSYVKNIVYEITDKINTITDFFSQIGMAKEMGGNAALFNVFASLGGSALGEKIAEKISPKIKEKIENNKYIKTGGNYLALLGSSPSTLFQSLREKIGKKKEEFEGKDTFLNNLTGNILGGIHDLLGITRQNTTDIELKKNTSILDHNKPAIFDNKVHRSITEIIPLYLSKILFEVSNLRSSYTYINKDNLKNFKEIKELHYDYENRKLDSLENVRKGIQERIFKDRNKEKYRLESTSLSIISTATSLANEQDKERLKNKRLQKSFTDYLKKASEKLSQEEFILENLIENPEENPKLNDLLDENTLEYLKILKRTLNKESKKNLDDRIKDIKNIYPIHSIKELFNKTAALANDGNNNLEDFEANIIAKGLTEYIINYREDITINNIINGKCFLRILKSDLLKVKDKISIFVFHVKKINNFGDIAIKSSLEVLLGIVNNALKYEINIDPKVFQILYDYSPLLHEDHDSLFSLEDRIKLSAENLVEGKLRISRDKEFAEINDVRQIIRAKKENIEEKILTNLKNNIITKLEENKTFQELKDSTNKFKETITQSKNPINMIKAFKTLFGEISNITKNVAKDLYNKNIDKLEEIKNNLNNFINDNSEKALNNTKEAIINNLKEFINTLDNIINEENKRYNEIIETMENTISIAEQNFSTNIDSLIKDKERIILRKNKELKALEKIKEKTIQLNNTIINMKTEGINVIEFLNNIKNEITKLINEYKSIYNQLETQTI